jgi:glutamate racemase
MSTSVAPAPTRAGAIGVFDSGFGGLTVLAALRARLPAYDYLYLGDSARVPYGNRSHEVVYEFTREAVFDLFARGCPVVVVACNTASARALRRIQQVDLPARAPDRRVLGVVRPSAEALAGLPPGAVPGVTPPALVTGTVAVLATLGTVASDSYRLELAKLAPRLQLIQQACPLWVPLVEAGETEGPGVEYFLRKYLDPLFSPGSAAPSRVLLGCTHYPLLFDGICAHVPAGGAPEPQRRLSSAHHRQAGVVRGLRGAGAGREVRSPGSTAAGAALRAPACCSSTLLAAQLASNVLTILLPPLSIPAPARHSRLGTLGNSGVRE